MKYFWKYHHLKFDMQGQYLMNFHGKFDQNHWTENVSIFTCFKKNTGKVQYQQYFNFWVVIGVLTCSMVKVQIVVW